MSKRLRILQVNTSDARGGAHRVSFELHQRYREAGHGSWLAVGFPRTGDADVLPLLDGAAAPSNLTRAAAGHSESAISRSAHIASRVITAATHPGLSMKRELGHENFAYPKSWSVLELPPEPPDVLHCHNLHGGYFDLRALPTLSHKRPLFLTLHDAWLLSGHCAHSFDCNRWEFGCGSCPDLEIYPPIKRDATARNWRVKQAVFARSEIYLATPCRWLMERAQRSLLGDAIADARVIPYGVDCTKFRPGSKAAAREALGLPQDAVLLLFSANGARTNRWRSFELLRKAVELIAEALADANVLLLALGEAAPDERAGQALVKSVAFREDGDLPLYYRAADLYLHPATVDTFPNSILESLACGTPVVATEVGGIPEQLRENTGALVPPSDPTRMAEASLSLLTDRTRLAHSGELAAADAEARFNLDRHASTYLDWYAEVVELNASEGSVRPRLTPAGADG